MSCETDPEPVMKDERLHPFCLFVHCAPCHLFKPPLMPFKIRALIFIFIFCCCCMIVSEGNIFVFFPLKPLKADEEESHFGSGHYGKIKQAFLL